MLSYNSYATPNLDNLSPFETATGRKAILAPKFEYKPRIPITGTHAEAKEKLQVFGTVYPNYSSFSDNYLLSRVIPKVPAGAQTGWHMSDTCHSSVFSSSQ